MSIMIKDITIKNYRSLENISLVFNRTNLLIGKNNSGKSSILGAIDLALSFKSINKEDIFVSPSKAFDIDESVTIDLKIVPYENFKEANHFNDIWTLAFGEFISSDAEKDNEYFAFRTTIKYDPDREVYTNKKLKINQWTSNGDHKIGKSISRQTIEQISGILLDAYRDISNDINNRKSNWSQLISRMKIDDDKRQKIEEQLKSINTEIVSESPLLQRIQDELKNATADIESNVEITPINGDLETLYKGMNILYSSSQTLPTSVENLGLGIRSWAVFSAMKAQIREIQIDKADLAFHSMLLIEEPESHIHPHAQRQLIKSVLEMPFQKTITTHSPFIVSQIDLEDICVVKKKQSTTEVVQLLGAKLTDEEKDKIRRSVLSTRGEILFANAVILVEGETEEIALSVFFKKHFSKYPFEMGVSILGVGSCSYYKPFVSILEKLSIPWFISSDGEREAIADIEACMKDILDLPQKQSITCYSNIFVLDNGNCFETYLVQEGYTQQINEAIDNIEMTPDYLTSYIQRHNNLRGRGSQIRNYLSDSDGGRKRALDDLMRSEKIKYSSIVAETITKMNDDAKSVPSIYKNLFNKIRSETRI